MGVGVQSFKSRVWGPDLRWRTAAGLRASKQEARTNPSNHLKVLLITRILQFQSSQRREVARKEVRTNPSDLVKFWPTTVETSLKVLVEVSDVLVAMQTKGRAEDRLLSEAATEGGEIQTEVEVAALD